MTYQLMQILDFVVAWEGCMKYYDYNITVKEIIIFIDNIVIVEQAGGSPPSMLQELFLVMIIQM